jgi:hypothetical protein
MTRNLTIYEALSQRLGRPATHQESVDEVRRILRGTADDCRCGGLPVDVVNVTCRIHGVPSHPEILTTLAMPVAGEAS